jgi:hypothetical protein
VADPWDIPPKPADLPDPELNPLMNPTLGKNLGRWAQVYFTSSPETREQAVGQLLRELERGETVGSFPANDGEQTQRREGSANTVLCPRCNEWNTGDQNFCGVCGTRIGPQQAQAPKLIPEQETRESFRSSSSSADDPAWLRERVFSADEEPEHSSRKAWIFAVIALLLILGGAAYLQWSPNKRASDTAPAPSNPDSAEQPASPQQSATPAPTPAPTTATQNAQPAAPSAPEPAPIAKPTAPAAKDDNVTAAARKPSRQAAPRPAAEPAQPSPDSGSRELADAQRLLSGQGSTRNPEVAASLLWKSVKKENAGAEVELADLYARGEGVGKNCEQARLLLTAAAKKGTPQAAQKLRSLQSGGCQ